MEVLLDLIMKPSKEICPFCKNDSPERIIDKIDLEPLQKYHRSKPFVAYSCRLCNGFWHFKTNPSVAKLVKAVCNTSEQMD